MLTIHQWLLPGSFPSGIKAILSPQANDRSDIADSGFAAPYPESRPVTSLTILHAARTLLNAARCRFKNYNLPVLIATGDFANLVCKNFICKRRLQKWSGLLRIPKKRFAEVTGIIYGKGLKRIPVGAKNVLGLPRRLHSGESQQNSKKGQVPAYWMSLNLQFTNLDPHI